MRRKMIKKKRGTGKLEIKYSGKGKENNEIKIGTWTVRSITGKEAELVEK